MKHSSSARPHSDPVAPALRTNRPNIDAAFRIAMGDLGGNIAPFQSGLLTERRPCILAGLDYDTPWTRDAAINCSSAAGIVEPAAARNTLLAVLERDGDGDGVRIGGQYWDAIIWAIGAWDYYLFTGDGDFLALALEATANSLAYFEATEFDAEMGLFRGPAVYGDGVSAYPDRYAQPGGYSDIRDWSAHNPDLRSGVGEGPAMHALSTNCVYYRAYVLAGDMARELGIAADGQHQRKADALRAAINERFWRAGDGTYRYLVDKWGGCDRQEGMGLALAVLLGVADESQARAILDNAHVEPAGVPCVWPAYERYRQEPDHFGRHCGTIWPHIQGFWGCAAGEHGRGDMLAHEIDTLTAHANRDAHFSEIYHPRTGVRYGGVQECSRQRDPAGMKLWRSCRRQTWSATAYMRLLLRGVLGLRPGADGLSFSPCPAADIGEVRLEGLRYRGATLDVTLAADAGAGAAVTMRLDGVPADRVAPETTGRHKVELLPG